jgi:hypothetical protein
MAKRRITQYEFIPGIAGAGQIIVPGKIALEDLLLVTNVTDNVILYSFAAPDYAGTTCVYTDSGHFQFPNLLQKNGGYTTITLAVNTSTMSASDDIQVFVEETRDGLKIRPWDFGTDAIERMRVSTPQSLIDADFEYGLQPTKWAGYSLMRGYPSAYELPGVDIEVADIRTSYLSPSPNNSLINVFFTAPHNTAIGDVVNVTGLDKGIAGFSRADGNFVVFNIPTSNTVSYFARGIVGSSANQTLLTAETIAKRGAIYAGSNLAVRNITSDGANPSTISVFFANTHGILPGTTIHANVASGTNADLASGPFEVRTVPTKNSFTYLARAGAAVSTPASPNVFAFSSGTILHRPQDGGVSLSTKSASYGASVVRQSKKYFRYQSGKGFLWSTGTLFKPNYDIQSVTSSGTGVGSTITITTDDVDHGLQAGANVELSGIVTSGYEGLYNVNTIVDDFRFTVLAKTTLGSASPTLRQESKVYVRGWHGASVRGGMFDEQNGLFWEYDGQTLFVVRRNSTFQVTGSVSVSKDSNLVRGIGTRFTTQLTVGDKIVIRGMVHYVTEVESDTVIYVSPNYRGISASGIKASLIKELRIPQDEFNLDTIDGNGPSGFKIDLNKMQMVGLQFTWYGAGFVDFMVRGSDGNWVYAHRIKNNNVNDEAYMRSGNLPIRYSIENESASSALTASMNDSQTTIPISELKHFPTSGTVYIDNEIISYTGKSVASGSGNLTGATRAASISQYQAGSFITGTAGAAVSHTSGTGVLLISSTCTPTLNHWGSALIMDGAFDSERGYLFNYQTVSRQITTTPVTVFVIRLAPSVENSQIGALGSKALLNRSQLLLEAIGTAVSTATSTAGGAIIEGILNPRNFVTATWDALNREAVGGQPSFAQVATSITWRAGTPSYALPGERIFSFTAPSVTSGAVNDRLFLEKLKELTGAPLGGDFKYPDGSDILAINVRMARGTANVDVVLSWTEAQA